MTVRWGVGIGDPARSAAALASAFEEASRKSRGLVSALPYVVAHVTC